MVTTSQVVTLLENVLFESPALAAANAPSWVAKETTTPSYATVSGLTAGIAGSPEISIVQQVVRYYTGALGRAPGGFEIRYYVDIAEHGLTAAQIAQGASAVPQSNWDVIASDFANSPEFTFIASGSNAVSLLYFNILHRIPGTTEIAYYNAQLSQGFTVGTLVQEFTNSPEYQTSINGTIQSALADYGLAVLAGNTPAGIPLVGTSQQIIQTLDGTDTSIDGKSTTQYVTVNGTPASAGQSEVDAVTGVIQVAGVTAATGVQGVAAVASVTPVAGQSAIAAASDGAVTITDAAFGTGGAGTISTITLNSSGSHSIINDNALVNLTLSGTAGSLTINNNGSNNVLNLTVNGLTNSDNAITDSKNEIQTLDITTTGADSTLAAFADSNLTTINLSGTNALTLSAINSSLTTLNVTGSAGFSDAATTHTGGLAALGGALTISLSSSGTFSAALDDTKQSFTGSSGTDIIMVGAGVDATQSLTAGSAANNEILFEGGAYLLTSASTGKFVGFQTVGVAGNVSGTVDLSVIDPAATGLHVHGANTISFTNVGAGATLILDPSAGATVTLVMADSTGASDSLGVAMSSDVSSLTSKDSAGTGIATLSIANSLGATDTNVSAAHVLHVLNDADLATLNVTGDAGLSIPSLTLTGATFTLANDSTNGRGVTIDTLSDDALTALNFSGAGATAITALGAGATLAIANTGTAIVQIGTLTDALTTLNLTDGIALGQAATPDTTNGLQDSSTAGVTIDGSADNAHVTINLIAGAASGNTDTISLGNGNNVVVDGSSAGTVSVTLGSGANLVELGSASGDTTGTYQVTLAARTADAPNIIVIGTAGGQYDKVAANLQVTGISVGDIIAFGNDTTSSTATLTATKLSSTGTEADAIHTLEAAVSSAHRVAYGYFNNNTYIVESASGVLGDNDTTIVELVGSTAPLTASAGYVTVGTKASTMTAGSLSGAGFTIPAGTATNLTLKNGLNVVTLVNGTTGVTDTFTGIAGTSGLIINYEATTGGTDTVNLTSVAALSSLTVNDDSASTGSITIGSFTDNALTSVTYNNKGASGAVMTQQALTSSSLNTINLTGSNNGYFFTGNLTTQGGLTIRDSNTGSETTTMGLNLAGGPNALTLDMTGAGKLATGVLTDDHLATLTLTGSGSFDVGTLVDAMTGAFTVNDNSTASGAAIIRLSGLSAATSLTILNGAGSLTDNSGYSDAALTSLSLTNNGGAMTVGGAGITANALTSISISGSGGITIGALADGVSGAVTITDTNSSAITFPLSGLSAATSLTVTENATGGSLGLGALADNALATLTLSSIGGGVTVDSIATLATSFTLNESGSGTLTITNPIVANNAATVTLNNSTADASIGVSDSAATVALNLTGSGTGTEEVSLTLATAALSVNDSSNSTGAATVTIPATTGGDVTSASLTNTGHGTLTVTGLVNGIADAFTNLTLAGTGQITTDLNVLDTNATVTVSDTDSGAAAISSLTIGDATTVTGKLAVTNSGGGALTIANSGSPGAIFVTTVTLAATGSSTNDISLTDSAATAVTVTLSGSGRQTLNFTHSGFSGDLVTLGAGPSTVTLNDATASITVGAGITDITLGAGHTVGSLFNFSAASASTANTTPVTTDAIHGFLLDVGPGQGDGIASSFAATNILTTSDVNPSSSNFWTSSNGVLSKPGASVLNFIALVQAMTQAGGAANTNGIAAFVDTPQSGITNTWIAFNDHGGHVSVIELVGVTALGLEADTTGVGTAGFIHIG